MKINQGKGLELLDDSVGGINTVGLPCLRSSSSEAASYGIVRDNGASVVTVVWLDVDHVDATE